MFLRGLSAARAGDADLAESLFLACMWSKWGHKYKYRNKPDPPEIDRADKAFSRALHYQPTYATAYYELGNIQLEASNNPSLSSDEKDEALERGAEHYAAAVALQPTSIMFTNNLGVALLNRGRVAESMPHFQAVLELHAKSFVTIKNLDPEGGAHLNLGHALHQLGRSEEAVDHWLVAYERSGYEYAKQAVKRIMAAGATDRLPLRSRVEIRLGDALAEEGKTREASLHFAMGYLKAPKHNLTASDSDESVEPVLTPEGEEIRSIIRSRMDSLAEIWNDRSASVAPRPTVPMRQQPPVMEALEILPDGTTKSSKVTPEMMENIRQMASKKAADAA
jgi:tetratricopeptide (TPR) repeat protein